ncbi:hypothetical protein MAPG_01283 [Magnaporthiopsis poae ATCC 64411]|uniref:Uncharacterized protein n=1 Tax=Magnaporthiopsis poae (strain ATCC 64411 / 73-15) TaxID=644358 RepID=A0A0C4DNA2_MAGP6|nr:hypothetical protein MAPG_01283 [Magnaporthiopsis poae ATCC 64411]
MAGAREHSHGRPVWHVQCQPARGPMNREQSWATLDGTRQFVGGPKGPGREAEERKGSWVIAPHGAATASGWVVSGSGDDALERPGEVAHTTPQRDRYEAWAGSKTLGESRCLAAFPFGFLLLEAPGDEKMGVTPGA